MFFLGRLRSWLRNRGRTIFHYHDGTAWRRADPILVGNRLEQLCPNYQELLDVLRQGVAEAPPGPLRTQLLAQKKDAITTLSRAARQAFGLRLLTETGACFGLTEGEALTVLTQYFKFMEGLAQDAEVFTDSPAAG